MGVGAGVAPPPTLKSGGAQNKKVSFMGFGRTEQTLSTPPPQLFDAIWDFQSFWIGPPPHFPNHSYAGGGTPQVKVGGTNHKSCVGFGHVFTDVD